MQIKISFKNNNFIDLCVLVFVGDGYFFSVGGYYFKRDFILILDIVRFKYFFYWILFELLWEVMYVLDKIIGKLIS